MTRTSATKPTVDVAVSVLLPGVKSMTPAAGVTLAVLLMLPLAEPTTVPVIVITTEPPFGKVGIDPATVLLETLMVAGQLAPPDAELQFAPTPVMVAGKLSRKAVLSAALGPALVMVRV